MQDKLGEQRWLQLAPRSMTRRLHPGPWAGWMMHLLIKLENFLLGVGIFLSDSKAFPKGPQVSGNVTASLSKKQTGSTGCVWHLAHELD